ncbi:MAG: tetratricopeptide repeat protein [bacterium]
MDVIKKKPSNKRDAAKDPYSTMWPWITVSVTIWIALIIRLNFAFTASKIPFNFLSDSSQYVAWAKSIAAGKEFISVYHQSPLYPFFLALIFTVFGPSIKYALIVQAIIGAITCLLVFYLSMILFKHIWMAVASAFVMAFYAPAIFYNGMVLMASLVIFLYLVFLIILVKALEGNKKWLWASAGIALGISALARATILLFIPFLMVILALRARYEWRRKKGDARRTTTLHIMDSFVYPLAIFLVCTFLIILPVTVRNYIKGKDFVLIAANAGITFYEGNNPWATGQYMDPPGLDLAEDFNGEKIASYYEKRTLRPSEISKFWFKESGRFIKERPVAYISLLLRKLLYFWNRYEIPNAENIYFARQYSRILQTPLFSFLFAGSLGLLGIMMALTKKIFNAFVVILFIFAHMIATVMFFVTSRYRLPITPLLIIFMVYAFFMLVNYIKEKDYSHGFIWVLAGIFFFCIVSFPWKGLNPSHDYASSYGNIGILFHRTGNPRKAIRYFEMAIEYDPTYIKSYNNIGGLHYLIGNRQKAREYWERGLELDPNFALIHQNLGTMYLEQGEIEKAIESLSIAATRLPYSIKIKELQDTLGFSPS